MIHKYEYLVDRNPMSSPITKMFSIKDCGSFTFCKNVVCETWSFVKFYLFWVVIHFTVSNLYIYLCAPMTMWGFIWSPFMAVAPHCQGLQWLFNISTNTISQMWTVAGVWFSGKLVGVFRGAHAKPQVVKEFVYPLGHSGK